MAHISEIKLRDFVCSCKEHAIGIYKGRGTTIFEEMEALAYSYRRIELLSVGASYYRTRDAYFFVEYTEEERVDKIDQLYRRSCKKILWLNQVSKSRLGFGFLKGYVNAEDPASAKALVDEFEETCYHAKETGWMDLFRLR